MSSGGRTWWETFDVEGGLHGTRVISLTTVVDAGQPCRTTLSARTSA
jgi:hypothetical protein